MTMTPDADYARILNLGELSDVAICLALQPELECELFLFVRVSDAFFALAHPGASDDN
jgi:hypothetical protein